MCGRYALTLPHAAVRSYFRYVDRADFPPRERIAPTEPVAVVRGERQASGGTARRFALMRWAFVPAFVKTPQSFPILFNARAETAAEKPSFRLALTRRRCLFMADAFYEWRRPPAGGRKGAVAHLFCRRDRGLMAFAGVYETWIGPNGEEVDGACILSMAASADVASVHDRMPAFIDPSRFDAWLDPDLEKPGRALALIGAPAPGALEASPVERTPRPSARAPAEPSKQMSLRLF